MLIDKVDIKGYRNFKDASIKFDEKTLIIGANDIGKTNLLSALRIILDKSLSVNDLEPKDSDFYAYEETKSYSITLYFKNVVEGCLLSTLKESISDDSNLIIQYNASRELGSKKKDFQFKLGPSLDKLEEAKDRFYIRNLNLEYISSDRDLKKFINRERKNLLEEAKTLRSEELIESDNLKQKQIEDRMVEINNEITNLSFVKQSTQFLNTELENISIHHIRQSVEFDIAPHGFIDKLALVSKIGNETIEVNGDGRSNQIFIALWAAKKQIMVENEVEITIYCIEEPEVHLHPHQQRKLADYLISKLKGQVFITSHSPQITSTFSPNSIVRLYNHKDFSIIAASNGCSEIIEKSFFDFAHRLDTISAESFFANVVFLVEGPSEVLFYKALAREIGIDLDQLNITILMVGGVGFEVYIKVLSALNIKWVVRTDNDVHGVSKQDYYQMAGVLRALSLYEKNLRGNTILDEALENKSVFRSLETIESIPDIFFRVKEELEKNNIFLSEVDLETDIKDSSLSEALNKVA
jgi:putative ATP-dependent endonuclease of OLD family